MIDYRDAAGLGRTSVEGVDSLHHFCFGRYQSADRMDWGRLRVLNRIALAPGGQRQPHSLGGMDVLLLVDEGEVAVRCGDRTLIVTAGELLALTLGIGADYGLAHRGTKVARLTEIWFMSDAMDAEPIVQQGRPGPAPAILASGFAGDTPLVRLTVPVRVHALTSSGDAMAIPAACRGYACVLEGVASVGDRGCDREDGVAFAGEDEFMVTANGRLLVIEGD